MPNHDLIHFSTSIALSTGEQSFTIEASIKGYSEWLVAVAIVMTAGGTVALGDLLVRPRGFSREGEHPSASEVPPGGIPARLLRAVNAGELLDMAQRYAREKGRARVGQCDPRQLPFERALDRLGSAGRQRSGRRGNGVEHYLFWAVRYVEKLQQPGVRNPIAALAKEQGEKATYVRDTINSARRYHLLTPAGRGRAGGELSERALQLLAGTNQKGAAADGDKSAS